MTTLQGQLTTKTSEVTGLNSQLTTAQTQITTKNSQIATLQGQLSSKTSEVSTLQGQITAKDAEIANLQKQLPTVKKGAWNLLKTFTGGGQDLTTDYFFISQNEARFNWTYTQVGYLPYMYVNLYKQYGGSLREWGSGELSITSGSTFIHGLDIANHYLEVSPSSGVGTWTITIEVWVPA